MLFCVIQLMFQNEIVFMKTHCNVSPKITDSVKVNYKKWGKVLGRAGPGGLGSWGQGSWGQG